MSEAVSSLKLVIAVSAVIAPRLAEGVTLKKWLAMAAEHIGSHPDPVLEFARRSLVSTAKFPPTIAEFVDAVLQGYVDTGLPLSDDAKLQKRLRARTFDAVFADRDKFERELRAIAGPAYNHVLDQRPNQAQIAAPETDQSK